MSHVRRSYIAMEKTDKKLRQPPKEFFELVDAVAGGRKDGQHDRSEELVKAGNNEKAPKKGSL